jgi:hypothetical protein
MSDARLKELTRRYDDDGDITEIEALVDTCTDQYRLTASAGDRPRLTSLTVEGRHGLDGSHLAALPELVDELRAAGVDLELPGRLAVVTATDDGGGPQQAAADGGATVATAPAPRSLSGRESVVRDARDDWPGVEPDMGDSPMLDHTDPDDLRDAYERRDTIADAAEEFDAAYSTVYNALVDRGIHETSPEGRASGGRDDERDATDVEVDTDALPEWLDEDPRVITGRESQIRAEIQEVLTEVDRQDEILDLHQRLPTTRLATTRRVVDRLGLADASGDRLADDDVLDERLPELWDYLREVGEVVVEDA